MTPAPQVWKITSTADAARARAAIGTITTEAHTPLRERACFLTTLTARLRRCLDHGGTWELHLHQRHNTTAQGDRLDVRLQPDDPTAATPDDGPLLTCPLPHPPATTPDPAGTPLPDALLRADEDTAAVVNLLQEQEGLVRMHRQELHHTNNGVLALHSELEAAALTQRQLLEAEQTARAQAERARRLLTFLGDTSAAITSSLSPTAILHRLTDLLVPHYAERVDVWLFDEQDAPGHAARGHATPTVVAARTGRPQHAGPHPAGLPGTSDLPPSALSPQRPLLAIPLGAHRPLGVLTLTAPGPRFDPDTGIMLIELARRVGIALDNARRYEQSRDTAEALQHAQLTDLPAVPGLLLAARYLPATQGLNIGGDWYDAFLQPNGSLLAVIGDVTGHGLHAAVVMGQLRTALRAYAVDDTSPGEILTRLHRMLRHLQPDLYATALVVRIRPGAHEAQWASAGHPPAVVRDADGTVRVLDARPGVMLGVPVDHTYADRDIDLPPGSSLMLYTDGLVERRTAGIDPGIQRLTRAFAALRTPEMEQDLDTAAEALLTPLLHDSDHDDDVCLLLCHTPAPAGQGHAPQPNRLLTTDIPARSSAQRSSVETPG
ncbi:GAF domain-containing SpoIIE family protein phosphatase [Streptomyces sp. NPDC051207]|uniref:PP2C family protein-serine/threonine phosphatase n=1 Tax=Streptomyces sp. NPDC051207 TaxID=3154641 RepID=UPI003435DC2E